MLVFSKIGLALIWFVNKIWFVMATMKSPGIQISSGRNNLGERFAGVMQASQAIRSELALTICESREMRLVSRRLRRDSLEAARCIAARRQDLQRGPET